MARLTVKTRDGRMHDLSPSDHSTIMESIRDAGIDELLALCGGSCSCATCHVYLDQVSFEKLEPMSEDENDLLDSSGFRRSTSRLSCQVKTMPTLIDMSVEIAPED